MPKLPPLNAFQIDVSVAAEFADYYAKWTRCRRCPLYRTADTYVLGRGSIPCDVLLIGEAPGPSENTLGKSFVGRAGTVLNALLTDAVADPHSLKPKKFLRPFSYAIVNTVNCIPRDPGDDRFRLPTRKEIFACLPHIKELIPIAKPKVVVLLGKIAQEKAWEGVKPFQPAIRVLSLYHPAYLLRRGGVGCPEYRRTLIELQKFLYEHLEHGRPADRPERLIRKRLSRNN